MGFYEIALAALILTAAADAWTTVRFLEEGRREANPIGRWFHETFGNAAGSALAKAIQVAFLIAVAALMSASGYPHLAPFLFVGGALLNLWVAIGNLD